MLGFGLLGFFLESKRIPLAPFVIGFVLGPIAEENLSVGLVGSNGSFLPIVTQRISLTFVVIAACGTNDRERQEDGQEPPPALCGCIHVEYPSMVGCVWTVVIQPRSAEDSASG